MFPSNMSPQEIINAINEAKNSDDLKLVRDNGNQYRGTASNGISIDMYLDNNDKIISAFPTYIEEELDD